MLHGFKWFLELYPKGAVLSVGWGLVVFSLILTILFNIYQKYYYAKLDGYNESCRYVGFICDYYGKRMPFMILSAFCLLFGHIFLGFIGNADRSDALLVIGLILLGLGYSIGAGSCWPCCGIIVKQKYLATALGFWACIDNGFQACMFLLVGSLTKTYTDEEYDVPSPNPVRIHEFDDARWLWMGLAICTMVWVCLLWYFDQKKENILMKPEEKYLIKRGLQLIPTNAKDAVDIVEVDENEEDGGINETTDQGNVVPVNEHESKE